jgi:glyoxylase-like metal-dependent hydrolase (beta-lactamase superfamily II)
MKTLHVILISAFLTLVSASAQSLPQSPGYYRATLGAFEITAISDGTTPRRLDQILSRPDVVNAEFAADHETQPVDLSINAYLIHTGAHLVLIDTGAGELFGNDGGFLIANLRAAGYRPDQIDTILLTHIHADHSGGLSIGGVRQYPNATVYVDARDLEYFVTRKDSPDESEVVRRRVAQSRATVGPYLTAKRIVPIREEGEIVPGITSRRQPGHTPGHTAFLVHSEGHQMLVWGDIVHSAEVQFEHPEVAVEYDVDVSAAAQARLREFEFAAGKGLVVASAHLSFPGLGHVRKVGSTFRWLPLPYSAAARELDRK